MFFHHGYSEGEESPDHQIYTKLYFICMTWSFDNESNLESELDWLANCYELGLALLWLLQYIYSRNTQLRDSTQML